MVYSGLQDVWDQAQKTYFQISKNLNLHWVYLFSFFIVSLLDLLLQRVRCKKRLHSLNHSRVKMLCYFYSSFWYMILHWKFLNSFVLPCCFEKCCLNFFKIFAKQNNEQTGKAAAVDFLDHLKARLKHRDKRFDSFFSFAFYIWKFFQRCYTIQSIQSEFDILYILHDPWKAFVVFFKGLLRLQVIFAAFCGTRNAWKLVAMDLLKTSFRLPYWKLSILSF